MTDWKPNVRFRLIALGGGWQMVTVTIQHRQGMKLRDLRGETMVAWRRARASALN